MVQWLGLRAFTPEGMGSIPSLGTKTINLCHVKKKKKKKKRWGEQHPKMLNRICLQLIIDELVMVTFCVILAGSWCQDIW